MKKLLQAIKAHGIRREQWPPLLQYSRQPSRKPGFFQPNRTEPNFTSRSRSRAELSPSNRSRAENRPASRSQPEAAVVIFFSFKTSKFENKVGTPGFIYYYNFIISQKCSFHARFPAEGQPAVQPKTEPKPSRTLPAEAGAEPKKTPPAGVEPSRPLPTGAEPGQPRGTLATDAPSVTQSPLPFFF